MNIPIRNGSNNPHPTLGRNRSLRALWTGQGLSSIGTGIYQAGLAWEVVQITGSTLAMGSILIASTIPVILLSFWGGALGDRLPKRRILIFVDFLRWVVSMIWAFTLFGRDPILSELTVFSIFFGVTQAFFKPTYSALIPDLIKKSQISRAVGINQLIMRSADILGPVFGGMLIAYTSFGMVVLVNALTFGLAYGCNFFLPYLFPQKAEKGSPLRHIQSGIRYFLQEPAVFWSVILITFANLSAVTIQVNLPQFIQVDLHWTPQAYGMVVSCYGLGTALAFLFLSLYSLKRRRGLLYLITLFTGGTMFLWFPLVHAAWQLGGLLFMMGVAFGLTGAISITFTQEFTQRAYRSRVMGIVTVSGAFMPLGYGLWGALGDYLSNTVAFLAAGSLICLIALVGGKTPLRETN
ncbi:MFS transporter [Salinithrix halophila]|uniref:MFS transporter n=1 Tax=Salinithrix halophila TaxID=1485204 RepID=A0ABV8JC64_9BACL